MPVIGWYHEMQKLSRQDALTFYKHYYAPNNAILIVPGDVTADEVKKLAEATYGKIPANPDISPVASPAHRSAGDRAARASNSKTRAPAIFRCSAITSCRATSPRSRARRKRSIC